MDIELQSQKELEKLQDELDYRETVLRELETDLEDSYLQIELLHESLDAQESKLHELQRENQALKKQLEQSG